MPERLTDRRIASLKPSDGQYHFDSEVSGLAVRIYESGRKIFCFDWREHGRQRRISIGEFPSWTIGRARLHASRLRLKADIGESVSPGRGERLADLIAAWLDIVHLTRRAGTLKVYRRLVNAHIVPAFGEHDPRALTRNAIVAWHAKIAQTTPVDANRALAVLSAFLSWCEHDGKVERNFAKGISRRPESARQVFLDADEIARAHAILDKDKARAAALVLRLCLLTGARVGEVLNLEGEQIDAARSIWIKAAATTKQKKVHIAPLQPEALAVAQALLRLELPNYWACREAWRRTRTILGRPDVCIHDLRHSRASALARSGASLPQIGALLGHTTPATTARYLHLISDDLRDLVEMAKKRGRQPVSFEEAREFARLVELERKPGKKENIETISYVCAGATRSDGARAPSGIDCGRWPSKRPR